MPDYQREYVWTDKEVQQLLDDINEQLDSGSSAEYFVGTVLVSPASEKNHYEVIDGQQRLTTVFLLLCALKRLFQGEPRVQTLSGLIATSYTDREGNFRTSLKLNPRYENACDVVSKIVELDADPAVVRTGIQSAGIPTFGSLENLIRPTRLSIVTLMTITAIPPSSRSTGVTSPTMSYSSSFRRTSAAL